MKWWHWLILELLIIFGVITWIYFFPSEIEGDFAKGMIGFALIYAIEECKDINRGNRMSEYYTVEQNAGENRIEGGVVGISGSIDIPDDTKRECKTCKNPYCSRTLEERQKVEVQVHTQYGWECCDKEKYLQDDGGLVLVKKEEFEKAVKSFTPKHELVDAIAYAIYYTANPDSEMCVPNCAYIQAEKMFEKWKGGKVNDKRTIK